MMCYHMGRMRSNLQEKPKSKILKHGYINIYSKLTGQEKRQIYYKTLYKKNNPEWNQSLDKIVIGNIEKIPFKDNSFDCVTGLWVLEHLENPEKVLDQIYRVLKPRCKFIFAAPNYDYLPLRI